MAVGIALPRIEQGRLIRAGALRLGTCQCREIDLPEQLFGLSLDLDVVLRAQDRFGSVGLREIDAGHEPGRRLRRQPVGVRTDAVADGAGPLAAVAECQHADTLGDAGLDDDRHLDRVFTRACAHHVAGRQPAPPGFRA